MAAVKIKEIALHFGAHHRLTGVLSLPVEGSTPGMPVVIPNTGLDPRTGPNRLHVHIARALAAAGHPVLRMDLGGLGDSDPAPGHGSEPLEDLGAALSLLTARRYGPQFAVIGNCSGAHDGYCFAQINTRIAAVGMIDGYAYDTPKHRRLQYLARLLRLPRKLKDLFSGRGSQLQPQTSGLGYFTRPSLAEASAGLEALRQRGVRMAFAYSGDMEGDYSYPDQLFDMFPNLRGAVSVWLYPEADHTFTRRAAREQMIQDLRTWLAP